MYYFLSIFLYWLAILFLGACSAPAKTGQKLYLYVTKRDSAMFHHTVAAASVQARKHGTELIYKDLLTFATAKTVSAITSPLVPGDSLTLVAYAEEWSPKLEAKLKAVQKALLANKDIGQHIRLGVWLMAPGSAPKLPSWLQQQTRQQGINFDAVSSASAERPSKAAAKLFFAPLVAYRSDMAAK